MDEKVWRAANKDRWDYIDEIERKYANKPNYAVVDFGLDDEQGNFSGYRGKRFGTLTTYRCKEVQDAAAKEKKKLLKSLKQNGVKYLRIPKYKAKNFQKSTGKKHSSKKDADKQKKTPRGRKLSKCRNKNSKQESERNSSKETDNEHITSDGPEIDEANFKKYFLESKTNFDYSMLTMDSLSLSKSKNDSPRIAETLNPEFSKNVAPRNEKSQKRITLFSTACRQTKDMPIENFKQSVNKQDNVRSISSDILNIPDQLKVLKNKSQEKKKDKLRNGGKIDIDDNNVAVNLDQNNLPSQRETVEVSDCPHALEEQTPTLSSKSKRGKKRAISDLDYPVNEKSLKRSRDNFSQNEKRQNNNLTEKQIHKVTSDKLNDREKVEVLPCQSKVFKTHSNKWNKKFYDKLIKKEKSSLLIDSNSAIAGYSNSLKPRNKHLIPTHKLSKNNKINFAANFVLIEAPSHHECADDFFVQVGSHTKQTADSSNKKGRKQASSAPDYPVNKKALNKKLDLNDSESQTLYDAIPFNKNLAPIQKDPNQNSGIVSKIIPNRENKNIQTEKDPSLRSAPTLVNNNSISSDFHQDISQSCQDIFDELMELFQRTYGKRLKPNHCAKNEAVLKKQKSPDSYSESYEVSHAVLNSSKTFVKNVSDQENISYSNNDKDVDENISDTFIIEEDSDQENIPNVGNDLDVEENTSETFIEKISGQENITNAKNNIDAEENTLDEINESPNAAFKELTIQRDIFCGRNFDLNAKSKNIVTENVTTKPNNLNFNESVSKIVFSSKNTLESDPEDTNTDNFSSSNVNFPKEKRKPNTSFRSTPAKLSAEDQIVNKRLESRNKGSLRSDSEVTNTEYSSSSSLDLTICLRKNHCFDNMKCNKQHLSSMQKCCADNSFSSDLNYNNTYSVCETENRKGRNNKVEHSNVHNVLAFKMGSDLKQKSKKRVVLNGVKSVPPDNQVNTSEISSFLPKNSNPSLEARSVKSKKQSLSCQKVHESNYSTSVSEGSKSTLKKHKPSLSSTKNDSGDSFLNCDLGCENSQTVKCSTDSKMLDQGKRSDAKSLCISEVFIDNAKEHPSKASDNSKSGTVYGTSHSSDLSCQLEKGTVLAMSTANCKNSKSKSYSQSFHYDLRQRNSISTAKSIKKHVKNCDDTKIVSSERKSLSACVEMHTKKRKTRSSCHKKGNSGLDPNKITLQKCFFNLKNVPVDPLSFSPYIAKEKSKLAVGDKDNSYYISDSGALEVFS